MYNNKVMRVIKNRTLSGRGTYPDHLIRELRENESDIIIGLKEAHRKGKIRLTSGGWVAV